MNLFEKYPSPPGLIYISSIFDGSKISHRGPSKPSLFQALGGCQDGRKKKNERGRTKARKGGSSRGVVKTGVKNAGNQ